MIGQRFGMLTVVEKHAPPYWICRCDCGAECYPLDHNLRSGNTKSCGNHRPIGKRHLMAKRWSPEHRAKLSASAKHRWA